MGLLPLFRGGFCRFQENQPDLHGISRPPIGPTSSGGARGFETAGIPLDAIKEAFVKSLEGPD